MSPNEDFDPEKYRVSKNSPTDTAEDDFDPEKYRVQAKKEDERQSFFGKRSKERPGLKEILNSLNNKKDTIENAHGLELDPRDNPLHLMKKFMEGMSMGGENINSTMTGKESPQVAEQVFQSPEERAKEPTFLEHTAKGMGQYSPLIAMGPMGLLSDIAAGLGYGALQSPKHEVKGAAVGGGSNAAFNLLSKMLGTKNPLIGAAMRGLLGGGAGYAVGGKEGAEIGSVGAMGAPYLVKNLKSLHAPESAILGKITPAEAMERAEAGNRLGTPLTPGEASARPDVTAMEANIGKSGPAAADRVKIGQERIKQQKTAINSLLDAIFPKTKKAEKNVRDLYSQAYEVNVPENAIYELNDDPVISKAMSEVVDKPAFMKDLRNVSKNSVAYLDQVKRALDDMIKDAKPGSNTARIYKASSKDLTKMLDKYSPAYKQARIESQKQIIRNNLEEVLGRKAINSTTFYNSVLKNDNQYKKLLKSLKNAPEAQAKLKDMKTAWEHLINMETPRTAAGQAKTSMDKARSSFQFFINTYHEVIGGERQAEALKYLYSPKWQKDMAIINMLPNKQRKDMMMLMIGKTIIPSYALGEEKGKNND